MHVRPLPPDYQPLEELRSDPTQQVLHARGPADEVVLRLASAGARIPTAELAVLAEVEAPGLARLVGYGTVPETGDSWVARSWIPGVEFGSWSRGRDPRQIGALLARLCPALQSLHERGFVHADLKPENLIVTPEGDPVLTDFGLARRSGPGVEISGSLFSVAPEVLLGGPVSPAADLFALGVLLHEALAGREVSARDFYARFPAEPYLTIVGTGQEELPEWSRDLLAELLDRDPTRRPASAAVVEATLRTRLALPPSAARTDPRRHRLRWSPLAGREAWLRATWESAGDGGWFHLPAGEDPIDFAEALRLHLTLSGERALIARWSAGDETPGASDDLDRFARRNLADARDGILLFPIPPGDPDARRHFEHLYRSWRQLRAGIVEDGPARLFALTEDSLEGPDLPEPLEVPPLGPEALASLLAREIEGDPVELANELHRVSGGALAVAARLVQRGFAIGDFVHGAHSHALRPDARVADWVTERSLHDVRGTPGRSELELFAALEVCGGRAPLEALRRIVAVSGGEFSATVSRVVRDGLATWAETEDGAHLVARGAIEERVLDDLGLERVRAMHATRAAELDENDEDSLEARLHRHAAEPNPSNLEAILERLTSLLEHGRPEVALPLAERFARHARRLAPAHAARAAGEVAAAWVALGQVRRAEEVLETIADDGAAVVERIRGRIAHERRDFAAAEAHLRRAAELEPEDGGESLFRRAMLCFEQRAEVGLDACLSEAETTPIAIQDRVAWNLETLRAMSLFRRGELAEARRRLEAQLAAAVTDTHLERESLVRVNLATLERRTGSLDRAADHLERAIAIQDERGLLSALAQARAMLGATLRELGRLHEAEATLTAAFEQRERLGDVTGARAVRGMLGLTRADRGRARAAIDELAASAMGLREAGRTTDALLLEARRLEMVARIEEDRPSDEREAGEPAADPRVLVARARAEALWGIEATAVDYARRSVDLARQLGLEPIVREGVELLAAFGQEALPATSPPASGRSAQDLTVRELLDSPPDTFDVKAALEAARRLAEQGREDLAARLAIAVVARAEGPDDRAQGRLLARDQLEGVTRGLTDLQARRARRTLLGRPDPWPRDLDAFELSNDESQDLDMDVISLLDINHRLVDQADLPSLLGEVVASAIAVTRAERGFLVLEEDGELAFDTARTSRRGDIEEPELEISRSALIQAMDSGSVLRLSNAVDDPLLAGAPSVVDLQLRSILVSPFAVDPGLRGAIYVDHRLRSGAFSDRAERLLELLAGQAALAIRQTRRMQEIKTLNAQLERRVVERDADLATARRALRDAGAIVPANGLVGSSASMREVHALIDRCAASALPVLVTGESGTGKELTARALHESSPRREGPFVSENCAALPASLIESELFGYVKGAFTGADRSREGLFERAHGGTLFLDEIGELPIELQSKLLRALETGEIRRVGDSKVRAVDCRLVAATNRNLGREVAEGRFRADLMYRLDVLQVKMPPLRDRVEDIPELVDHFLRLDATRSGVERAAGPRLLSALCRRSWPGNVRELANEVSRLCVLSAGDLDDPELVRAAAPPVTTEPAPGEVLPLAELERAAILNAIECTGGDKRRAAELLGISRAKVYQRLKEWAADGESAATSSPE